MQILRVPTRSRGPETKHLHFLVVVEIVVFVRIVDIEPFGIFLISVVFAVCAFCVVDAVDYGLQRELRFATRNNFPLLALVYVDVHFLPCRDARDNEQTSILSPHCERKVGDCDCVGECAIV